MGARTNDKKEQIVGIVLILLVVVSAALIAAANVTTAFEKRCQESSMIILSGKTYKCSPVGENNNDTNP